MLSLILVFELLFFLFDENNNAAAIGYRFESPEGGNKHNYYHAQPIRSFSIDEMKWPLPSCPRWLPNKYPTFALDVQNLPSLFVSLFISLYGLNFVQEMQKDSDLWNLLKPYVDGKMICLHSSIQPMSRRKLKRQK